MDVNRKPFLGRERVIFEIVQGLLAPQPQSYSLVGPKLIGKSHLLTYLAAEDGPLLGDALSAQRPPRFQGSGQVVVVWVDCDWQDAQRDLTGWIYRNLADAVREQARVDLDWARIESQPTALRRIYQAARALSEQEIRPVLLLDNFDRVFENQSIDVETIDELRPLTLELALLVSTEQPLHDLDRELAASPLFNVMTQVFLGLLETAAARNWVLSYGEDFPGVSQFVDELLDLTGMHPFLLRKLGDSLLEVRQMLPGVASPGAAHLPLLRLRLAEHGRLLFETNWRRLQRLPPNLSTEMIQRLLRRLTQGVLPLADLTMEQAAALNWLINQAMVTCCLTPGPSGYQLFTPLFAEYLAGRLGQENGNAPVAQPQSPAPVLTAAELDQFTKIEASLLRYFQSHPNETVTVDQLLAGVWKRPDATNRRVQEAIRRLRMQLEETTPSMGTIKNDRGRGYRFVPAH